MNPWLWWLHILSISLSCRRILSSSRSRNCPCSPDSYTPLKVGPQYSSTASISWRKSSWCWAVLSSNGMRVLTMLAEVFNFSFGVSLVLTLTSTFLASATLGEFTTERFTCVSSNGLLLGPSSSKGFSGSSSKGFPESAIVLVKVFLLPRHLKPHLL